MQNKSVDTEATASCQMYNTVSIMFVMHHCYTLLKTSSYCKTSILRYNEKLILKIVNKSEARDTCTSQANVIDIYKNIFEIVCHVFPHK